MKNLSVRSVGLVDRPAIEEPFTGFKRGEAPTTGKQASAAREDYQEVAMDEKMKEALEALFKSALEPFVGRLDAVEAKAKELAEAGKSGSSEALEAVKSSMDELKASVEKIVADVAAIGEKKAVDAEGLKAALEESGKKFQAEADRIAEETVKRFEAIEARVEKMEAKGSQRIPGQDAEPEKKSGRWPSFGKLAGAGSGAKE